MVLVDGDAAAADGWPGSKESEQRSNLMHYITLFDKVWGCNSIVVFSERRRENSDQLTPDRIQFAGPRWTVAQHMARIADTDRSSTNSPSAALIATNQPQLFRNASTISIGELLDYFIAP